MAWGTFRGIVAVLVAVGLFTALAPFADSPQTTDSEAAIIRFVDVGPALCVVASFPGGQHLLYDAGHWTGSHCYNAVREIVDDGVIELVVISHPDSDHLGELDAILAHFSVETILHTGFDRNDRTGGPAAWRRAMNAIAEQEELGTEIINLTTRPLEPGHGFALGEATAVFIAGWGQWDADLSSSGARPISAELRNVISIVIRIDYRGRSILLTGDSIGRRNGDAMSACRDAQAFMVDNHQNAGPSIAADVMLSSHHGGDNGDASCFIEAVAPGYIIISAGHDHRHPRSSTVERYLAAGVPIERIFRTDRGDDEGAMEWDHLRVPGCRSQRGYDDVVVEIPYDLNAPVRVTYRNSETGEETARRLRAQGLCRD